MQEKLKKTSLIIMIAFYLFAGYYHFANPSFYLPVIPPYLAAWAGGINTASGMVEILLALLLIPKSTRRFAGVGIIIMLFLFIPSHIYFIQKGEFQLGAFTLTPMISLIRLIIIQPMLMVWAWWSSR